MDLDSPVNLAATNSASDPRPEAGPPAAHPIRGSLRISAEPLRANLLLDMALPGEDRRGGESNARCHGTAALAGTSAWLLFASPCLPLLLAVALAGCVSRSKADAQARDAFMAGQQQALTRMQQAQTQGQGPCVTVNGEVRNRVVPWMEGMTLARALLAADYYGASDPGQIIIVHNGLANRVDPKQLLTGVDIPLQPGDIVQLVPQAAAPGP